MPAITPPTEKPINVSDLLPIARHEIGVVNIAGVTYLVLQVEARNAFTRETETRAYVLSFAGAALLTTDLTTVIESESGILALVKETLAQGRAMRATQDLAASAFEPYPPVLCLDCGNPVDAHGKTGCPSEVR